MKMANLLIQICLLVLAIIYSCEGQSNATSCYCPTCPRQCPDGWLYFQNSCYLFGDSKAMGWTETTHYCSSHHSSLATIESKDEDVFLKQFLRRLFRSDDDRDNYHFWIGGTDESIEGLWTWYTDDTVVAYTDWAPGQPDTWHGNNEDCILMYGNADYAWHDAPCPDHHHPLCEIRLGALAGENLVG